MRYLNGFILIGIILLFISIAGMVKGNALLTEPGQPTNTYAWLEYLAAAILMLVNGAVSIWNARRHEIRATRAATADTGSTPNKASGPAPVKRREP
ncbi:MAG: hypothetical protein ACP5VE_03015 [Chthonomonadales bacterium]